MKTFEITEKQLQEIGGRLNALSVQGVTNCEHVAGIMAVLGQIAQAETTKEDNVVEMKKADDPAA